MAIIKWTPMIDTLQDMDKIFNEFQGLSSGGLMPAVDIYEEDGAVVAEIPLPGCDMENVNVSVENDMLTIESRVQKKKEIDEKNYYRKEIRTGSFHRVVQLPAGVDGSKTVAVYESGVLKITMPKREELKPKTIKIDVKK